MTGWVGTALGVRIVISEGLPGCVICGPHPFARGEVRRQPPHGINHWPAVEGK